VQFPIDFAQSLELIFRVSPTIRDSELRTFCVGGPAFAPHVVAQLRLAAGERLNLELALDAGSYKIRSPQLLYDISLQVSEAARSGRGRATFSAETPLADTRILVTPRVQQLNIHNQLAHELVVRVERSASREDALTAARAACLAGFRELFPSEVLATGRLAALGRTAFLVAHVCEQRRLLHLLGDARAFELVAAHLRELSECAAAEGGALIKTASGSTICAFDSAAAAVRAALLLRTREGVAANDQRLDVRLLVHQGSAVAATLDGRLDYFGDTVETALELAVEAPAHQILLSQAVAEDRHVIADVTGAGHSLQRLDTKADHEFGVVVVPVIAAL
jgi:class 3 adenylate cyclase